MADPIINADNVAVLLKLESIEGVDANPAAAIDALPVERDSIQYNAPFTIEQSNEATGSLVAGAPLIVGQPATVSFRSRIKGAGNNVVYTSSVKPPMHQALQACGKRGQFTPMIGPEAPAGGTTTGATLGTGMPSTAGSLVGMPLIVSAGPGAGYSPLIISYGAGKAALFAEILASALSSGSTVAIPANWTYAGTSPADQTARATDQPSATIYIPEDGTLLKFVGCRGVVNLTGQTARPGFAEFAFSGIYAGKVDAPMPADLTVAGHLAPTLVQGSALSLAAALNRKAVPISQWTLSNGGDAIESPEDPNTPQGFGAGIVGSRVPTLAIDPLGTTVAARNINADIAAGNRMSAFIRAGTIPGNRWALTLPAGQPVSNDPTKRGKLRADQIGVQGLSLGRDAFSRDTDSVLCFF